jgi:hypothetical protein
MVHPSAVEGVTVRVEPFNLPLVYQLSEINKSLNRSSWQIFEQEKEHGSGKLCSTIATLIGRSLLPDNASSETHPRSYE